MPTGNRKNGEFCWINMITSKPAEAQDFYAKLLGWTYTVMPGMGHGIQVGGRNIGAMFDLENPNNPPGTRAMIGVMVKTESADAMSAKFNANGGRALTAFDVGPQGRMAIGYDPAGANIDLWEGKGSAGTDADDRRHGAPSWFETITTDVAAVEKFYTTVFGWTSESTPMGDFDYTVFSLDGAMVAGMMPVQPDMGEMKPNWAVYFTVDSADAAVKTAAEIGGVVCVPVTPIPHIGLFAGITSPQGINFFVIQYTD